MNFRLDAEMNTTLKLINALKAKTGAVSDYDLAKKMGITRAAISNYQTGKRIFDDETAIKVASMLEIDPSMVLASIHIERAKSDAEKFAWTALFERLGGVAAALTLGIMLNAPNDAQANAGKVSGLKHNQSNLYIIRNRRKQKRTFNPFQSIINQLLLAA